MIQMKEASIKEGGKPILDLEVCETVLGSRSGYISSYGCGPKPKSRVSSSSQKEQELSEETSSLREEVESISSQRKKHISELQERLAQQDSEVMSLRDEISDLRSMIQEFITRSSGASSSK